MFRRPLRDIGTPFAALRVMQANTHYLHAGVRPTTAAAEHLIRARQHTALALIIFMTALSVVLVATLGLDVLPILLYAVPTASLLVWYGSRDIRADER